ncbi:MAG: hypothetical protein RLZZ528_2735 [Pseudomonadota bacterium]
MRDEAISTSVEALEAAVLPQAGVAHTSADAPCTAEMEPLSKEFLEEQAKSPAQWAYERLILYISNFEKQLDERQEIALGMAGSDSGALLIEGLGYFAPDIVTFYGRDEEGARTQLIQHVSQLNVMLRALPKQDEAAAPRRIGFELVRKLTRK